jgi:hypothetical protein
MGFAPFTLAIPALNLVNRIVLALLPVVVYAAPTLTHRFAANHLVGVIL